MIRFHLVWNCIQEQVSGVSVQVSGSLRGLSRFPTSSLWLCRFTPDQTDCVSGQRRRSYETASTTRCWLIGWAAGLVDGFWVGSLPQPRRVAQPRPFDAVCVLIRLAAAWAKGSGLPIAAARFLCGRRHVDTRAGDCRKGQLSAILRCAIPKPCHAATDRIHGNWSKMMWPKWQSVSCIVSFSIRLAVLLARGGARMELHQQPGVG